MRVALAQFAAATDSAANRETVRGILAGLGPDVDLVVFPEAAMHDFGSLDHDLAAVAETMDGPFVQLLREEAARLGTTIVAGMFESSDSHPFNTLVVVSPDGEIAQTYRKVHLYDSFGYRESDRLSAGPIAAATVEVDGHTVGLMTCYDLRFPELARSLIDAGAEVLIIPAAWVAGPLKDNHWVTLNRARAIENTVPVIAVGQCGDSYTGHSLVIDAMGSIVEEAASEPTVLRAVVDFSEVERVRLKNPSLANRRMRS